MVRSGEDYDDDRQPYSQPLLVHHPLDTDGPLLRVQLAHALKGSRQGEDTR